jgi:hypothetical protein
MILFATPNLQTIDLINLIEDCLLILTIGVASAHFVNLLMAMYRYWNPPIALGNGPRMSSPHTTNDHEGGDHLHRLGQCVDLLGMKLARPAYLYQLDSILKGCRLIKVMLKGFTDQRVG